VVEFERSLLFPFLPVVACYFIKRKDPQFQAREGGITMCNLMLSQKACLCLWISFEGRRS
jgi:hypothetical protein